MRVVSWNCNGALRNKLEAIDSLEADVLIIQECEDPTHSSPAFREWAGRYLWVGDSKHKGIGIFPRHGHTLRRMDWCSSFRMPGLEGNSAALSWKTQDLKLFQPFKLDDGPVFVAAWTKGNPQQAFRYIGQLWKYIQIHRQDIRQHQAFIIGDLNSNVTWDRPDQWWNHSDVVSELEAIGLTSLYHHQSGEAQGAESRPTFFLQRNQRKPYHIDYIFGPRAQLETYFLEIGSPTDYWLKFSDHLPLILST